MAFVYPRLGLRSLAPAAALIVLGGAPVTGAAGHHSGTHGSPGAAGARDPYFPTLGNGGYDVRHYTLTLDYDPGSHRLTGTAEITARAAQDLSAFNLDLHGMAVRSAAVDGTPAVHTRAGDELTLRPAHDVRRGDVFRAVVRYDGAPGELTDSEGTREGWLRTEDGAIALGQPQGSMTWFPGNHHPGDKATYDISVTVPDGLTAVSNGDLRSQRPTADGQGTTFAWHSAQPMATYLATVGVGAYEITRSRPGTAGIPVYTAADRTVAGRVRELLDRVPELTNWSVDKFGPYPFSSTGVIVEREGDADYALETQNRSVFTEDSFDPATLVHELAHQWYGDSVTPRTWRDVWLSEGFATYAEWLYLEEFEDTPVRASFEDAFGSDDNWAFPPADQPGAGQLLGDPVYERGAMTLQKVREAVGDTVFFSVLRGWAATHRHGNASTQDFTAYVERMSGKDLGALWDVWLYGDGRPSRP
ncbi:M1 family metallopeptidase [Streptomyces marianii]|uniref:Aminopeptidase N n=1 Tax=Streptomyces marianii TaxID=1817406 RepID=A0A5R9DZG9_9ACTN|nr:M1 family metallopeptidase [Streptomyces marianii]TLQ42219.1 M1 family metallopeptidase [Streptomyces marianii]